MPRNHGPNVTCLAALCPAGMHTPCVFAGARDGMLFGQWMGEWLVPILAPGTTVVLDNRNVPKQPAIRTAIEAAGCHLRFLPASSPDFYPIELAFQEGFPVKRRRMRQRVLAGRDWHWLRPDHRGRCRWLL